MNTVTYLSHQFDVLASARTPPSTPTDGSPSFFSSLYSSHSQQDPASGGSVKRVKSWSTKSFLFPRAPESFSSPPRRSFSTPTDLITFASVPPSLESSPQQTSISSQDTVKGVIRQVFFIRLFVLVCHLLSAAWSSVATRATRHERRVQSDAGMDGKDLEKEVKDGGALVHSEGPSPYPPSFRSSYFFRIRRSVGDQPSTSEPKQEPESPPSSLPSTTTEVLLPAETSRTPTPVPSTRKVPFLLLPKTLVLDLDETLIHSTSRPMHSSGSSGSGLLGLKTFGRRNKGAGHMVEVVLGGRSTLYHVYKRPFVDFFLRTVSGWYTLVIFTASMQEYADPVIDWLDAGRGILARRLFRDSCTQLPNGSYTKDLSIVEQDLARVCLVDNSPVSYRINEANGIPVEGWTHDPSDEALLDLLPVLDSLRFTTDVRRVLGIRGFS